MKRSTASLLIGLVCLGSQIVAGQQKISPKKETEMKADLAAQIDLMKKQAQVMVDTMFSFGELGFQEFETSKYLSTMLENEGFKVERGVAGIPTAFVATCGSGKPMIALGSDIDDIPQASQTPGVAYHDRLIEGARGHGEGHDSGMPLQIIAALAVKKVMQQEHLEDTLKLWRGVAEDVCLFAHVGNNLGVAYGPTGGSGLVSIEYLLEASLRMRRRRHGGGEARSMLWN